MAHRDLPLSQIALDPHQPRKDLGDLEDLAKKIWDHGLLQAVVVTQQGPTAYILLAGERRLTSFLRNRARAEAILAACDDYSAQDIERALAYSSWTVIPAHIWPSDPPLFLRTLLQIQENDTSKPLTLIERADAYVQAANDSRLSVKDFCDAAGIGRSVFYAFKACSQAAGVLREALLDGTIVDASVSTYFRQLPSDIQAALVQGARKEGSPLTRGLVLNALAGVQKARAAAAATTHLKTASESSEEERHPDPQKVQSPSEHPVLNVQTLEWVVEVLSSTEPDVSGHRAHALETLTAALDRCSPLVLLRESWSESSSPNPAITHAPLN